MHEAGKGKTLGRAAILSFLIALLQVAPHPTAWAQSGSATNSTSSASVVQASVVTVIHQHRGGTTMVAFHGCSLLPLAKGRAKVSENDGRVQIKAEFRNLEPARQFGDEYLTYVLWAIGPQGQSENLGEILLDGDKSRIAATTSRQEFGLIVTAEPYFAVSEPSNVVVFQNEVLGKTNAQIEQASVSYRALERSAYGYGQSVGNAEHQKAAANIPLELLEARNAVQIAMNAGALKYAAALLSEAQESLSQAQNLLASNRSNQMVAQASRDAMKAADNAWRVALQCREEQRRKNELGQFGEASVPAKPQH